MPDKLDVALDSQDREFIWCGLRYYVRHLEKAAELEKKVGKDEQAGVNEGEVEAIRSELIEPGAEKMELYDHHRPIIRKGLEFLARGQRAAMGTVNAAGRPELSDRFEEDAKHVEGVLKPKFEDQGSLL
jgi:hypothetical protein